MIVVNFDDVAAPIDDALQHYIQYYIFSMMYLVYIFFNGGSISCFCMLHA